MCNSMSYCSSTVKDLHSRCHLVDIAGGRVLVHSNVTLWHPCCGSLEVIIDIADCVAAMPPLTCTSAAKVLQCWGMGPDSW